MATFSIGQAVGSGFSLIKREPKAVLLWILVYALFTGVTYGLLFAAVPELLGFYQEIGRSALGGVEPNEADVFAMVAKIWALVPVFVLLALVAYGVMFGAIYRAVLHPEDRRFGYLRLGRQELWLIITMVVWTILIVAIYVAMSVVMSIVGGIIGAAMAGASPGGIEANAERIALPVMIGMLVVWLAMLWIMLRLSLAFPMSHDQGRFVMFESWKLTRGQSLKMLAVGLLLFLIIILIEIAAVCVFVIASVAAAGAGGLQALMTMSQETLFESLAWWLPLYAVLGAAFGMLMFIVLAAPIADIYRQLHPPEGTRATV